MPLLSPSSHGSRARGRKPLRAIDLFCGAGGLSEGLRQAGFRVIAAVELDSIAARTYRLNHRSTKLLETDVKQVTRGAFAKRLGGAVDRLDLLAACPPCQGFSTMRTLNGGRQIRDQQNALILEVLRLARSLRPRAVMVENVPGLTKTGLFAEFVSGLERIGYQVEWKVLDVVRFGVPQRRRRLILLACLDCAPKFAEPATLERSVRNAIGHLPAPRNSRDALHRLQSCHSSEVMEIIRAIPRDGGSRSALPNSLQLECHKSNTGFHDVYGRMAWNKPAPTITTGCINPSKGRFLHPTQTRAISLREAALLQSFPARYRFNAKEGRYPIARLIGNALPPEFIRRHALAMRSLLESLR